MECAWSRSGILPEEFSLSCSFSIVSFEQPGRIGGLCMLLLWSDAVKTSDDQKAETSTTPNDRSPFQVNRLIEWFPGLEG
jgi:hypothetical protein